MLPPGTLKYLKGHHDAIVIVVLAAMALGVAATGRVNGWVVVALLAAAGGAYHLRCVGAERHRERLAQIKAEGAAAEVEKVRARHRDVLHYEQQALPLGGGDGPTTKQPSGIRKGGKS